MTAPTQPLQTISRLAPLDDVYRRLDAVVAPVAADEVDVTQAENLVLATDVMAPQLLPDAPAALRDGWAVRAELLSDASAYAPVLLSPAPEWVEAGQALPDGADAVLAPDDVMMDAGAMQATATPVAGDGLTPPGGDFGKDQVLRRAGTQLRALDVAILRAAGVPCVSVRRPRVHVTRGNPSIDDEADMVTPLIARAVTAVGGEVRPAPANATSAENLATALADENVDAAIVIGGTGAGRRDHSVHTLARLGRVEFHGIGVSPGETAAFGMIGARPVLLLPGRLDAALAMWLLLGRRMLARLTGLEQDESGIAVPLARKVVSTIGLAAMVPVRRTAAGLEPLASGPVALQALAQADGWILVPPENEGYAPGALVTLRPFP